MNLSSIAELVFFLVLAAGVWVVFGYGWALIVAGALGLIGAQFYGLAGSDE